MQIRASWDDGGKLDVRVADLMTKYKIKTIFYIPVIFRAVNIMSGRESLSESDFKDIASEHEIGSHTYSHPHLTKITLGEAKWQIEESRRRLHNDTHQKINSFCYPRGYYNNDIKLLVKAAGYKEARTTKVGSLQPDDKYALATTVHVGYNREEYYGLDWYEYAMRQLRKARELPDCVYHLWGHSEEVNRFNQWRKLETFLKELTA